MRFSIIVPVFNAEKYIRQCVDSILLQTEQDFEIILVNDGSKDGSGSICDNLVMLHFTKIKVVHQKNQGQLKARQVGMLMAKGDYILFMDADDYYLRYDALSIIWKAIVEYDSDIVIFRLARVNDKGIQKDMPALFKNGQVFDATNKCIIYEQILEGEQLNNIVLKGIKHILIKDKNVAINFDGINNGEDLLQFLPIITAAKRIVYIDYVLYGYRNNDLSVTNSFNPQFYDSVRKVYIEIKRYVSIWGLSDQHTMNLLYYRYIQILSSTIGEFIKPKCQLSRKRMISILDRIANDELFKEAYDNINFKKLNIKWRIIFLCLKKKNIFTVFLIVAIRRYIVALSK